MKDQSPSLTSTRPVRHTAVVVAALILLALFAYRVYGPRFTTHPTVEKAAAVPTLDLNRAERAELIQVPGLGPHLADAILNHRAQVGRFESLDDLHAVKGVGPKTWEKLKPWLKVEPLPDRGVDDQIVQLSRKAIVTPTPTGAGKVKAGEKINVNSADETALQRLPGVGPVMAGKIVAARDAKRFESVEDLKKVKGIGPKTMDNIRPFITVETR